MYFCVECPLLASPHAFSILLLLVLYFWKLTSKDYTVSSFILWFPLGSEGHRSEVRVYVSLATSLLDFLLRLQLLSDALATGPGVLSSRNWSLLSLSFKLRGGNQSQSLLTPKSHILSLGP